MKSLTEWNIAAELKTEWNVAAEVSMYMYERLSKHTKRVKWFKLLQFLQPIDDQIGIHQIII